MEIIEQNGSPKEIYNHPKTSFVARFIGTYNVFSKNEFEQHFKIGYKYKRSCNKTRSYTNN